MFENLRGNATVQAALHQMITSERIPQTLLLAGPEGVGKATLARRFAARLLGQPEKIEQDDLSLEHNRALIAEREKWPSEKRADDPLLFATHPDFVTVCPEGPLRQISIQQMRQVRERAQLLPLKGHWRVFLIDQFDRTSQQAADSLLKTLEEPPSHLILLMTAQNPYDLPSTIRSRSVIFHLAPLGDDEMHEFAREKKWGDAERRISIAAGCPGYGQSLDLAAYEKRRAVMLSLLEAASGSPFAAWVKQSEPFLASKNEKLELYFRPLYSLLEDLLLLHGGAPPHRVRNRDIGAQLAQMATRLSFDWLREAIAQADELVHLQRRNVQKGPSVDHYAVRLRGAM